MGRPLRVGLVGLGVGLRHLEAYQALSDRFQVTAVCALDAPAQGANRAHGVSRFTDDFGQMCAMGDLDVIDICTPPSLHYSQSLRALASGKHVICEKPIAGSLKEIDDLARAQEAAGRVMMPIFQYRFGRGLQKLKAMVEQGVAGKAYLATAETAWRRRQDYYTVPWRGKWTTELGGMVVSHAIHAIDMLLYVLGPARRVSARTATRVNDIEVEDCFSASLEMADGSLAALSGTLGSAAEISRHRFCFANLSAESNQRPYTSSGDDWVFTADTETADRRIRHVLESFSPRSEGYEGQLERFHESLENRQGPPVTLEDARAAMETITALYLSSRTAAEVALPLGVNNPLYAGLGPVESG